MTRISAPTGSISSLSVEADNYGFMSRENSSPNPRRSSRRTTISRPNSRCASASANTTPSPVRFKTCGSIAALSETEIQALWRMSSQN